MNKLIIIAQPSKKGFLWELAFQLKKQLKVCGDEVFLIDLYDNQNFQPNLEFQDMKILNKDPNRERFQKKISWADELIFIFPIWWGSMPAILKNFIDTNFEAGFAYKFQKGSPIPKKLLKGKTARIYTTCDGFKYIYNNYLSPIFLKKYIEFYILGVFGIKLKEFKIYDRMRKRTREEKDEILKEISLKSVSVKKSNNFSFFRNILK